MLIDFADDSKIREDAKTRNQLPDYDDFQGFDLSCETELSKIAHEILLNFINPPWGPLSTI